MFMYIVHMFQFSGPDGSRRCMEEFYQRVGVVALYISNLLPGYSHFTVSDIEIILCDD